MKAIRINAPGAGDWIMAQTGGVFRPELDHSIATFNGDEMLGGFVFTQYLGNAIAVHDWGDAPGWCTRDLLWMVFHYAFRQLKCHKLIAPTPSDNRHALALNLRAGFKLETVIRDVFRPGCHLMILTMVATECRWLDIVPQRYSPGGAYYGSEHLAWKDQDDGR